MSARAILKLRGSIAKTRFCTLWSRRADAVLRQPAWWCVRVTKPSFVVEAVIRGGLDLSGTGSDVLGPGMRSGFLFSDYVNGCNQLGKLLGLDWVSELVPPVFIRVFLEDEIGILRNRRLSSFEIGNLFLSSCRFLVKFNSLGASEQEECGCEFCEGHYCFSFFFWLNFSEPSL